MRIMALLHMLITVRRTRTKIRSQAFLTDLVAFSQSQKAGKAASKMIFQEHGAVLITAGKFQKEFLHGVPEDVSLRWHGDPLGPSVADHVAGGCGQPEVSAHKKVKTPAKNLICWEVITQD